MSAHSPQAVITHKSQEKAIALNLENNSLDSLSYSDPLSTLDVKLNVVLIKIPKSLDLFHLFLGQIAQNSSDEVMVICGFMTRHFTPKMIQIAEQYFEVVTQSRALKKARVLTLKNKKQTEGISFVKDLNLRYSFSLLKFNAMKKVILKWSSVHFTTANYFQKLPLQFQFPCHILLRSLVNLET